ncbi:MAG: nucleotide sugar dehydrogenase [Actinomycetota bacterium]|nr:nucleotide sugar dehydrogenase [Actinomycetota bacterium]
MATVGVYGAGYAGLVTAACFAELGHSVIVRDVVPEKVAALEAGAVPFHEPGLPELIARNRSRLRFTLAAAEAALEAEFLFICVDTPPTYSGEADLSRVWTVLEELPALDRRAILVMKSTVPVGTGETVRAGLDARGLDHIGYVSNPEFLAEGSAVRDFLEPDRVVVGAFEESDGDAVEELHRGITAPVVRTDVASAEMIKLASNAFLGTRISFINEIANVCELVGADVEDVARGMGLDKRIGTRYLRPGIGFGGSCLSGRETVLVRQDGRIWLSRLDRLFHELAGGGDDQRFLVEPSGLDVLAWRPNAETPEFHPVAAVTRRWFEGEVVELRTKMGRRVRSTPDHPFLIRHQGSGPITVKESGEVTSLDWIPVAQNAPPATSTYPRELNLLSGLGSAGLEPGAVIVRPREAAVRALQPRFVHSRIEALAHARGRHRAYDIVRTGSLRLPELDALGLSVRTATLATAKNGTHVPATLHADLDFWRVVGLYTAEGHCTADGRRLRLQWSFHPTDEHHLVEEVARFWEKHGVKTTVRQLETTTSVVISSRILAAFWLDVLGLGRNCYEQRVPDLLWSGSEDEKRAFLAGLWEGDGSWSLLNGGPGVALEYGTVSAELADGVLRLLADLGVVARVKVSRVSKSTRDTYWIVVSGADQIERLLELVRQDERSHVEASIARQAKRIAPTGYRRSSRGAAWVRVVSTDRRPYRGFVYSLEVPSAHTFVTTGGLITHNCFPKDISFLKLLAGNSGYHFQLLNAVIEVNELQKRRVVGKLQKHLGTLRGRAVALLGLSFKPNTDDLRDAPSIVLASRLLAEGADVRAWDPVADAREVLKGVTICESMIDALRGADAAVIVTEWEQLRSVLAPEFRDAMRKPLIVDGRNLLDPDRARAAGFAYEAVGRRASALEGLPEARGPERVRF